MASYNSSQKKTREEREVEEREQEVKQVEEFIWTERVLTGDFKMAPWMAEKVCKYINLLKKLVYSSLEVGQEDFFFPLSKHDNNIFYGDGGLAYMNFHLFLKLNQGTNYDLLKEAMSLIEKPLRFARKMERLSFLSGDAGLVTLAAVLYHYDGRRSQSRELLDRLVSGLQEVIQVQDMSNDLLCGRAGYLFCLLFARKHIGLHNNNPVTDDIIRKAFYMIVRQGQELAATKQRGKMLLFDKALGTELGARSGMASILHTLMQVEQPDLLGFLHEYLPGTLEYMMHMRLRSGNRPDMETKDLDMNMSWFQGSGGWVHMFIKAHEILLRPMYLEAAVEEEEYVWKQGYTRSRLQAGVHGLCNGMGGNGYCHLALYRATKDIKYFQRACRIGLKSFHYNAEKNTQIRPFSLMNGVSGTICFLTDLLSPLNANFPCYEV